MSASDLSHQLRLLLENSPDALSLSNLLLRVDDFVVECSSSPDSDSIFTQLEDDLQNIYNDVIDHAVFSQTEIFLSVLYHLRPILPPVSLISTWFDIVLRPALREPKLPTPAVDHAKELIIAALEPGASTKDDESVDSGSNKKSEKVGNFRRRLMDLYLLDAYNESSGDDVLEWAELDDVQREKKACWKANLEDVLVRVGLQRPHDLLTELYHCFASPSSRLQLLMLLTAYTSQPDFSSQAAAAMASHPVMQSLLLSLMLDNSSTACTICLTVLTKLLPIFAVKACEDLKRLLPQLLLVLARIICWKERPVSDIPHLPTAEDLGLDPADYQDLLEGEETEDPLVDINNKVRIRDDLGWQPLELAFTGTTSSAPPPQQYFAFLYYLFPCNALRFLRFPISYLTENDVDNPYAVGWEEALDEDLIRSKSEPLLRGHVLHPLLIWRDATAELSKPDFWTHYDISRIVGECTMLDVRNASLGMRQHLPPPKSTTEPSHSAASESIQGSILSTSAESTGSSVLSHMPTIPESSKPRVSLQDMMNTSIALKSGLDIEIVDQIPSWPSGFFQQPQPRARSPSRDVNTMSSRTATPDRYGKNVAADEDMPLPSHVVHALASLQREVLLLKSELNFELWMARENVRHIGRLYRDRVVSKNAEVERQGLHNKMREYKQEAHSLQRALKDNKEQATQMKNQYADWNRKLQDKVRELRTEKTSWLAEATAMRAADNEAKETFEAQGKLLADATNRVFQLETTIKENAHKIDRLHDYERQIDQLIKMQRLWESDVHQLNSQNEYLKVFTSKYKNMELQLETYEQTQVKMDEGARIHRQQVHTLEARLSIARRQLDAARRAPSTADLSQYHEHTSALSRTNERLREENADLREEVEEMKAMIEMLRAQVSGRVGVLSSPRMSPLLTATTSFA